MFPLWFPLDAFFELFECEFKIFYDYIFINNIYSTNSIEPPTCSAPFSVFNDLIGDISEFTQSWTRVLIKSYE